MHPRDDGAVAVPAAEGGAAAVGARGEGADGAGVDPQGILRASSGEPLDPAVRCRSNARTVAGGGADERK